MYSLNVTQLMVHRYFYDCTSNNLCINIYLCLFLLVYDLYGKLCLYLNKLKHRFYNHVVKYWINLIIDGYIVYP